MKILPPTPEGPPMRRSDGTMYDELLEAAGKLKDGEWLPIEFETQDDSERFAARIRHNPRITEHYQVAQRGPKVYLTKKVGVSP